MKTPTLSIAVALVGYAVAYPGYLEGRSEWEAQEWIEPGPDDCELPFP